MNWLYVVPLLAQDTNTESSTSDESLKSSMSSTSTEKKKLKRAKNAHFYWVTREAGSFEWFKGVMNEVAEMDHKVIYNIKCIW